MKKIYVPFFIVFTTSFVFGQTPRLLKNIHPSADSSPWQLTNVDGTLFFSADDGTNGIELWKSDGTSAGTVMIADIRPSRNSYPENLTNVDGTLFFRATDGTNGFELWKSDGTTAGTLMVADISPFGDSFPVELTNVNSTLFFCCQ